MSATSLPRQVIPTPIWKTAAFGVDRELLLLVMPLIGVTLLAKFAIPPFGARGIAIGMFLNLLVCGWGLFTRRLVIAPEVLAALLMMFAFAGISPVMRAQSFSLLSLFFLVALHVPYALRPGAVSSGQAAIVQSLFSSLCLFMAWCGILQFGVQFVLGPTLAFPIENFVPAVMQVQEFNKQGPLAYGYEIYRANGVFLLEPSFFSQVLAVGIVFELAITGSWLRAGIMVMSLLLSYSGTGLVVLAVCLPVIAWKHQRWQLIPLGVLGGLVLLLAADYLNLDLFVSRAGEFQSTGSSAFARFVGGFYMFDQFLWTDVTKALFGYGAGTFKDYAPLVSVPVTEMAMPKMVFEFGLLGGGAYFGMIGWLIFRSSAPLVLKLAVFTTFFLNGNYVVFSHGLALSLLAWSDVNRGAMLTQGALVRPRSI